MSGNPYASPEGDEPSRSLPKVAARDPRRLLEIVTAQRAMMWLFLFKLAIDFSVSAASEILAGPPLLAYFCLFLIVEVVIAYFVFRISHAIYDLGPAVVCALLALAPCLGSLTVLVLNGTVMDYLRKNGVKVGFMGATRLQIEDLRNDIHAQLPSSP